MNMFSRDMIPAWVEGKLTPVEKMQVHSDGLRHKAVSVFVMHRDKVLIQRRALSKYHTPGLWANTCCTHPLWNEAPEACAIRRLREELGITGLYPSFRDQVEYRADVGGGMTEHEVVDIYLAEATPGLEINPNPDEVMETRWISFYDLAADVTRRPQNYTAWLQIYLNEHTERIFGTLVQA
ncbi:MAG: isopentenyl-diphosphate Delta-isomerase [Pseudomonadota bacterium]